jgi:hypothetical protein
MGYRGGTRSAFDSTGSSPALSPKNSATEKEGGLEAVTQVIGNHGWLIGSFCVAERNML